MRSRKMPRLVSAQPKNGDQLERMRRAIEHLSIALAGLAERQFPSDPLPCFCVRHEQFDASVREWPVDEPHDEWCENARIALKEAESLRTDARPA